MFERKKRNSEITKVPRAKGGLTLKILKIQEGGKLIGFNRQFLAKSPKILFKIFFSTKIIFKDFLPKFY
jgi:hypothetical protein